MNRTLQFQRLGLNCGYSKNDVALLQRRFKQRHYLLLSGFLDSELLELIQKRLSKAKFVARDTRIVSELLCTDHVTNGTLITLFNNPELFSIVRKLTGCGPIWSFIGRTCRMARDRGHYLIWHDDHAKEGRLAAISVNLSVQNYSGGEFQMRRKDDRRTVWSPPKPKCGDACLFEVSSKLEHHLTPVTSSYPRTVFAGWFIAKSAMKP